MDKAQRIELEQRLDEEIGKVKADIQTLQQQVQPVAPDKSIGRLTRMEAINEKNVHETTLAAARERLARLERAREHAGAADFGLCEVCGKSIPSARLLLVPEATVCVQCADQAEG